MRRHLAYLWYVLRHKWFVLQAGRVLGVSIWQLIVHDWSKFLPSEWFPYARTFYSADGTRRYVDSALFARAWMLHQHRNPHHWQYWLQLEGTYPLHSTNVLVWDHGGATEIYTDKQYNRVLERHFEAKLTPDDIPDKYLREMVADWIGAGRAINGVSDKCEVCDWYEANKNKMWLHPVTRERVEQLLTEYSGPDWLPEKAS